MANKPAVNKMLCHQDREEIVSKLLIGVSPKDIHEWLKAKYPENTKMIIAEKTLKLFKDNYLDIYSTIKDDFGKAKTAMTLGSESDLELSIRENPTYNKIVLETVGKELDIKLRLATCCNIIETRMGQLFDIIEEDPRNINTRHDRMLKEYIEVFGGLLEKAYKIVNNGPDQIIQHNVTVQRIDESIVVFYEAIKNVLSQIDLEASMHFMELFQHELNKLKDPANKPIQSIDSRLSEVRLINETIDQKIAAL
jgi:hypothetical protein